MTDQRLRDLGARIEDSTPMHDFEDLVRRARRRVTLRRAVTLAAVVAITIAAMFGVAQVVDRNRQTGPPPADRTEQSRDTWCPTTKGPDCFADIHGWIVYGGPGSNGIWAVNPAGPGDPEGQIHLTDGWREEPLGWSSDGTRLLIARDVPGVIELEDFAHAVDLVVLNADGTETRVTRTWINVDGSISPDGTRVVYSSYSSGVYAVDLDGGTPRLLLAPVPRHYPGEELAKYPVGLYNPVFSPDGTQIAYFDGMLDWGHSLRIMRSDGTHIRVLLDEFPQADPVHVDDLVWSPDGQRLAFSAQEGGIWIIGVDGSGLTKLVHGVNPAWSPDGTRISYQLVQPDSPESVPGTLRIADADGTHVTGFGYGESGPWNPLPLDR